jgi:hypothetical protein
MIHGNPFFGNLPVDVLVTDRSLLQAGPECLSTLVGDEVLHGFIDKAAALAGPHQTVNGFYRGLRQDDVDAFAHGISG